MGSKNKPGDFDCYANAKPDEPMFVLLARDSSAPLLVESWANRREALGIDREKVQEARDCAASMRAWRDAHACADHECRHGGESHSGSRCSGRTIYGGCDCYGFVPNLERPT